MLKIIYTLYVGSTAEGKCHNGGYASVQKVNTSLVLSEKTRRVRSLTDAAHVPYLVIATPIAWFILCIVFQHGR